MRYALSIGFSLICIIGLSAQTPQGFNYQAVARDAVGQPRLNVPVAVKFSILQGSVNGPVLYSESHNTQTNNFGLFTLVIGQGLPLSGNFNTINWGGGSLFIRVEIDNQLSGTTPLLSVPYALYAERANIQPGTGISVIGNTVTNTGDLSSSNELQTLIVNGNSLSISNGNTVQFPGTNYQSGLGISIVNNTISNTGDLSNTNELQSLILNGNTLSLTNSGTSVTLPSAGGPPVAPGYTTAQLLNLNSLPQGAIVLNTDNNALYYYAGSNWYKLNASLLNNSGPYVVSDCLLAYYTFDDGNGTDVAGDFDGNNFGCDFTGDVNSYITNGMSATFDGTDRISCPSNPLYNLSQGSISFWYKGTAGGTVVFGNTQSNSGSFRIRIYANLGQTFIEYNSGNSFNTNISDFLGNTWRHFVVTISSTEKKLYVDGVLIETITSSGGMAGVSFNNGMLIGRWEGSNNFNLTGKLDNLRIHCKALTANEVFQIFNAGQ